MRLGGSTVRMGKYLVSIGGVSPSGYPINSIEMFDTRRAHLGRVLYFFKFMHLNNLVNLYFHYSFFSYDKKKHNIPS